ncbi:MAG: VWA domain-containing protein, partial [Vicinamibacterales bacterium]
MPLTANLLVFGRLLRSLGLDVSGTQMSDAIQALLAVGLARRDDVRYALRALWVRRRDQLPVFDAAFDAFWQDHGERWGRRDLRAIGEPRTGISIQIETVLPELDETAGATDAEDSERPLPEGEVQTWSAVEALRDRDLADMTPAELAQARAVLESLTWSPGEKRTRRWAAGAGPRIDLRRAWRQSLTTGEIVTLPTRARTTRRRPIVLFADVSGSMERYSRMLLHFAHVLTRANHKVEAFVFSTRLTRITLDLRTRRIDDAVTAAARRVPDWSGGTRIGDALRTFHVRWARYVLGRGAVVLMVSDGWDRGDPQELAQQVARLQRSCHRLIWLSPLLGTADYRPLTRGLVASLPYVDDFLPVRTLRNLEDLAAHLN